MNKKVLVYKTTDLGTMLKNDMEITVKNIENYFDKKDENAFATVYIHGVKRGIVKDRFYLARKKYIPRVRKTLGANATIYSREEANKLYRDKGFKFEIVEVEI